MQQAAVRPPVLPSAKTAPPHPSQITPIPAQVDPPRSEASGRARAVGLAGISLGGLAGLAGFIQAIGGLPPLADAVSKVLAHGWPAAVAIIAASSWWIHWQWFLESRAERAAAEARQTDRDERIVRAVNSLLSHAESEDLAHQRNEAAQLRNEAVQRELIDTMRELAVQMARLAEPTARQLRPTSPPAIPPSAATPRDR